MPDLFVASSNETDTSVVNDPQLSGSAQTKSPLASPPFITHHAGLFATYGENPSNMSFGTQEPDEKILLFLRRDFITNVPWIVSTILLAIAPTLFITLARITNTQILSLPASVSMIILSTYYLIVITYLFVSFITWYFNISIVTNTRIMDLDFADIIYKNVSETKLDLVQDVSYKQIGVIRTFFDYGDVRVQTAAAVDAFAMNAVPKPQKVVEVIQELMGKEKEIYAP